VEYGIEKPSNKLLAVADLDSGTWARSKKLKSGSGKRKAKTWAGAGLVAVAAGPPLPRPPLLRGGGERNEFLNRVTPGGAR
jgi:hypothetical protein